MNDWRQIFFGFEYPDPQVGQVWRSKHSGRSIRVKSVRRSDCGKLWHIALEHEDDAGFIGIAMDYCMWPHQWRRMLREEGRELESTAVPPGECTAPNCSCVDECIQRMPVTFTPVHPTDEEITEWADSFIKKHTFSRPIAVQIATEAAKWVRSKYRRIP